MTSETESTPWDVSWMQSGEGMGSGSSCGVGAAGVVRGGGHGRRRGTGEAGRGDGLRRPESLAAALAAGERHRGHEEEGEEGGRGPAGSPPHS